MTALKKIFSLLLVICMLASMLSLTACKKETNENENEENETNNDNGGNGNASTEKTYTVTVEDKNDKTALAGVKLVIFDGSKYHNVTTDENGKASLELPAATETVSVMVTNVIDGYLKPEKLSGSLYHAVFAKDATELTVKLEKEQSNKVTYTVTVVDQNGNAVVGMHAQLCPNGICLATDFVTDENGEITAELSPDSEVHIQLKDLGGYTLGATVDGTYHGVIESGETEITIVVTKN